nr:MAG TPA: hypothetical protein [Caudoviricetes sp.]
MGVLLYLRRLLRRLGDPPGLFCGAPYCPA